jgi:hypothetical protein
MTEMAPAKFLAIDQFVKNVIIDCYKTTPEDAKVIVTCVQNFVSQESREFTLNVTYVADKNQRGNYTGAVQLERNEQLPDHATSIRNMIAAHGIPASISQGSISKRGKTIEARIIEINAKPLRRFDFWIDNAAEILRVAPAAVANAYYRLYKNEVSGRCISGAVLFAVGEKLKMPDNEILNRLEAYYTR